MSARKLVLLTGVNGLLGQRFAKALITAGHDVFGTDLQPEAVASLKDPSFRYAACDVTDESAIRKLVESFGAKSPDVFVHNAAAKPDGFFNPTEEFDLSVWNKINAVNVTPIFLFMKYLLPQWTKRGSGNVIGLSSIYGLVGPDSSIYEGAFHDAAKQPINTPMIYSTTKGAIVSTIRYIATTYGSRGIRANCLVPGGVRAGQNPTFEKNYSQKAPLGRMAEADEIASGLEFLASDRSSYMNGQNLVIDGGWTAW